MAPDVVTDVVEAVAQLKPRLRGWIHAVTTPLALAAGIVLIVLSPPVAGRVAAVVFTLTSLSLFGMSAVYHRGRWSAKVHAVLRRIDHANIFLIIAGTYTPLAVLLLPPRTATVLLVIVWGGALAGLLAHLFWMHAPRWVYVPVYVALGWVAVAYMQQFAAAGGAAVVWLVIAGGVAYTLGAVIYGTKFPDPSPRWFGFHEIFHALTVVGFACHTVAIFLAAVAAR
ncbi:Hly-III family protein [Xylanimonas cellulosilytica DSM 15894]|uniref:Hly-III family protein n=1 Tax=Xylanimonas cellulosilytica (strain DSM 15894 / JCM 12276 / CECT 5975 / KCTC 9989 / LMG 20990 / NBRC 107835 / XIL07) TaxID=446471 RepID=D1BX76_XYLCX|nr:hemolysin III family protein [Xylanimonas cellulosilytica]ACZ31644.1 Hly-III family protein [Xylanimonas cellulosilytica DSM 15894]